MVTYKQAGVSVNAGDELVRRIKKITASRKFPSAIGGFSGLFPMNGKYGNYYLSGCCDGVGTKLKIAFLLDKHDTVGIDLVAMNVNDLICTGAKPLFFLDYFACGKLDVKTAEKVIRGIHKGCEESGCILLGGETAEMPGFYKKGEYDLAGFAIGIVDQKNALSGKNIREGDAVIGLPSSGIHSNGYSLVRKIFSKRELTRMGHELLIPTRIYVKKILSLLASYPLSLSLPVKGIAHITGGGWIENIPRILPKGFLVELRKDRHPVQEIFKKIQKKAKLPDSEMYRTFNMGIGLVLIIEHSKAESVLKKLNEGYVLGKVVRGKSGVTFL